MRRAIWIGMLAAEALLAQPEVRNGNATSLQGLRIHRPLACSDGYVITWVAANNRFECLPGGGGGGGGPVSFSSVTPGTNTGALAIGSGGSLAATGSGTIDATSLGGTPAASYVTGPGSSSDHAVARYDGATGKLIQNSGCSVNDAGVMTCASYATTASGTGQVQLTGGTSGIVTLTVNDAAGTWSMKLPASAGNASDFLQTDGNGNLTWAAGGSSSPGGSNTHVQYNGSGNFGGSADLTFDSSGPMLCVGCSNGIPPSNGALIRLGDAPTSPPPATLIHGKLESNGTELFYFEKSDGTQVFRVSLGDMTLGGGSSRASIVMAGDASGESIAIQSNDAGVFYFREPNTTGWRPIQLDTQNSVLYLAGGTSLCASGGADVVVKDCVASTGATRFLVANGEADSATTVTATIEGTIKAGGYQSADGSPGVTVTTCASFKNGLCVGGS